MVPKILPLDRLLAHSAHQPKILGSDVMDQSKTPPFQLPNPLNAQMDTTLYQQPAQLQELLQQPYPAYLALLQIHV